MGLGNAYKSPARGRRNPHSPQAPRERERQARPGTRTLQTGARACALRTEMHHFPTSARAQQPTKPQSPRGPPLRGLTRPCPKAELSSLALFKSTCHQIRWRTLISSHHHAKSSPWQRQRKDTARCSSAAAGKAQNSKWSRPPEVTPSTHPRRHLATINREAAGILVSNVAQKMLRTRIGANNTREPEEGGAASTPSPDGALATLSSN
ncbi:uncharacterized protein LOC129399574 [Sorex araneus]|uniref:uncharacterized protein LOC129399574 n=1 Tax=Sorex araneus TaxID=42254 RepID=UPI0024336FAB|nr:uncharacterized protein LOC129399574 [Sorex araneus]